VSLNQGLVGHCSTSETRVSIRSSVYMFSRSD